MRSGPGGVDLVAFSAAQHVHRALVYEDFAATTAGVDADPNGASNDLRTDFERRHRPVEAAAGAFGASLYVRGELAASALPSRPDAFAHRAVGKFPEVMASMALRHERLGDRTSALVTAEWFANDPDFEGWALAHAFNARALLRAGRTDEARDAARVASRGTDGTPSAPREEARWRWRGSPAWRSREGGDGGADADGGREARRSDSPPSSLRWGAAELREMLDTGGEANRKAAEAVTGGVGGGAMTGEAEATARATRAAQSAFDAVALGAAADAARGRAGDWDAVRAEAAAALEDVEGLRGAFAGFIAGADVE